MSEPKKYIASEVDGFERTSPNDQRFHFCINARNHKQQTEHVADVYASTAEEAVRLRELFINELNKKA